MSVRAAYFYDYMTEPNVDGDPIHLDDLVTYGANTCMVKILAADPDDGTISRWRALRSGAEDRGLAIGPVYNYQDATYQGRYANPDRRYQVSTTSTSILSTVACPLDPTFMRSMFQVAFQRLPDVDQIWIDPEFYGAPGGFHNYTAGAPCQCDGCKVDWWRYANYPTSGFEGEPVDIDPDDVVLPDETTLLTFEKGRVRELAARYGAHVSWRNVGLFTVNRGDSYDWMTEHMTLGLIDAGLTVSTYQEQTYGIYDVDAIYPPDRVTPGQATHVGATLAAVTGHQYVGGIGPHYWNHGDITAELNYQTTNGAGWWIFTTYSMWLGQTAQTALAASSDYKLLSGTVAQYWAAIAAAA